MLLASSTCSIWCSSVLSIKTHPWINDSSSIAIMTVKASILDWLAKQLLVRARICSFACAFWSISCGKIRAREAFNCSWIASFRPHTTSYDSSFSSTFEWTVCSCLTFSFCGSSRAIIPFCTINTISCCTRSVSSTKCSDWTNLWG